MAQIPNFQLPSNVTTANIGQGLSQGFTQGTQLNQSQQALNQQKQLQQAQIQQMQIDQNIKIVDSLTKNGIEYPTLMKSFWPAIATSMNKISPDYGLDPKTPPEDLGGAYKFLSGTNDALQAGVITPQQAHTVVKQGLQDFKPQSIPKDAVSGGQDQQLPGQAGYQQKFDQLMSMGPHMAQAGLPMLEATPEAQQYKSALEQKKQLSVAGQAQHQDAIRSLTSSFESQSQDAKNVFDNLNVFNSMMEQSRQFQGAKDTTGAVNAEKASLLAFAQMAYPGTGRPGNMEMLENMEKSGPYGTLLSQALNKIDKGEIMTDSQIKGLRQAAVGIAQAREQSQTDQEKTTAQAIKLHGGDPQAFLRNYRPSTMASTSPLFPNQNSGSRPLIGEVRKLTIDGKQGMYKSLGHDGSDPDNWVLVNNGN